MSRLSIIVNHKGSRTLNIFPTGQPIHLGDPDSDILLYAVRPTARVSEREFIKFDPHPILMVREQMDVFIYVWDTNGANKLLTRISFDSPTGQVLEYHLRPNMLVEVNYLGSRVKFKVY